MYAKNVATLRAYQIGLDAVDADGRRLPLVDVAVDQFRPDYVFAGQDGYAAADTIGLRVTGALNSGHVNVASSRYLGTFRFRTAPGASARDVTFELRKGDTVLIADERTSSRVGRQTTIGNKR